MNTNFMKALYLLDKDKIEEAELCLKKAIEETTNTMELIQIHACSAELFYQLGRTEESLANIEYVLKNTQNYECPEKDTALELKKLIEDETEGAE